MERKGLAQMLQGELTQAGESLEKALMLVRAESRGNESSRVVETTIRVDLLALEVDKAIVAPHRREQIFEELKDALPALRTNRKWRHLALCYYALGCLMGTTQRLHPEAVKSYQRSIGLYETHALSGDIMLARAWFFTGFLLKGYVADTVVVQAFRETTQVCEEVDTREAKKLEQRARRQLQTMGVAVPTTGDHNEGLD